MWQLNILQSISFQQFQASTNLYEIVFIHFVYIIKQVQWKFELWILKQCLKTLSMHFIN